MEQLGIDFNATGSVMSRSELEELRRKRGECITCGRKCFQKKLFKMIPITDHGRVLNGRCLNCKPLDATENGLIPAVSRPATKEDLARFSRSQSNLALSGPGVRAPSSSGRRTSGRSYSGGESSSRSLGGPRAPSRNLSGAPAATASAASMESSARNLDSSARNMDSSSRGSHERLRGDMDAPSGSLHHRDLDPRYITPTNSSRDLNASAALQGSMNLADLDSSHSQRGYAESPGTSSGRRPPPTPPSNAQSLDGASSHSTDRRPAHGGDGPYGDGYDNNHRPPQSYDYAAGRRVVNEELYHTIDQMSGMYVDEQPSMDSSGHQAETNLTHYREGQSQRNLSGGESERGSVARSYSGEGSHASSQPRHGLLNRGGEVNFGVPPNLPRSTNGCPHAGSNRTLSSMSSVEEDVASGKIPNPQRRFVPPNQALYEEESINRHSVRSQGSMGSRSPILSPADERAIEQLHAANGDCVEILEIMSQTLNSPIVQSYALKEISCLHLGPDDQDRLAGHGAMDLITASMHANPVDIELQIHGCRAIWNGSGTPENQMAFVDAGALDIILADMDRFIDNAEVQECAMGTISNLAAAESNLYALVEKGTIERVVEAMNKHSDNVLVQAKGCSAITNMASHLSPLKKNIMDMGGGGAVVICMVMHSEDFDLQEKALRALKNLSSNNDDNKIELANIGSIDAVITAMQVHRDQAGVQEAGAWTLSNLASNNDNKAVIGDCGGIDVVIRAMWVHSDNVKVQEWCSRALYTLTLDRHNSNMVLQVGGISAIVNTMQAHVDSGAVQEMGCAVLCNLAFDESSKMRIVDEEALDAIVLAMVLYAEDPKVQESACEVLLALAIVENFKSMQASNIGELARSAAIKFPENCREPAEKLIHVLDSYCGQY